MGNKRLFGLTHSLLNTSILQNTPQKPMLHEGVNGGKYMTSIT